MELPSKGNFSGGRRHSSPKNRVLYFGAQEVALDSARGQQQSPMRPSERNRCIAPLRALGVPAPEAPSTRGLGVSAGDAKLPDGSPLFLALG